MQLQSRSTRLEYRPGEEIFLFPEETGFPFLFDVEEELTSDRAKMRYIAQRLRCARDYARKAKAAILQALEHEDSLFSKTVRYFFRFHRDDIPKERTQALFPDKDIATLRLSEMVPYLKLKRFGAGYMDKTERPCFIVDLSLNPAITDELMVVYFDWDHKILAIAHES